MRHRASRFWLAALALLAACAEDVARQRAGEPPELPVGSELVAVVDRTDEGVLELVIGPATLSAEGPNVRLPIQLVSTPIDGWLHGFDWQIIDAEGRELPEGLLHHVNLIDPDRRELFFPIARRVIAAGRETTRQETPRRFGYPVTPGTRFLAAAMFASPKLLEPRYRRDYEAVYLRLRLMYSARGDVPTEPVEVYPIYLEVMGPLGPKAFPVPPGRTVRSWAGSPAIDGTVLALGAHLHNYAEFIRLEDVTEGRVIWEVEPNRDADGRVRSVPTSTFWPSGGLRLRRDHTYRVVVAYDNPTSTTIPEPDGGMGEIGGVFVPAEGSRWPELDRQAAVYLADLWSTLATPQVESHSGT